MNTPDSEISTFTCPICGERIATKSSEVVKNFVVRKTFTFSSPIKALDINTQSPMNSPANLMHMPKTKMYNVNNVDIDICKTCNGIINEYYPNLNTFLFEKLTEKSSLILNLDPNQNMVYTMGQIINDIVNLTREVIKDHFPKIRPISSYVYYGK